MLGKKFLTKACLSTYSMQFSALEARQRIIATLALEKGKNNLVQKAGTEGINPEIAKHYSLLSTAFNAAARQGAAKFQMAYDETRPLSRRNTDKTFQEALIRLYDDRGEAVYPDALFDALDNADQDGEAGRQARLWFTISQIREFYRTHQPNEALSLNISAADMRNPSYRDGLEETLKLAGQNGFKNLILEALEQSPWGVDESQALRSFRDKYGVKIAIDDYGAPDGFHTANTLVLLSPDIVKLDGHAVRNFIEKDNKTIFTRLEEVEKICPEALVVAEWVSSAEDASLLMTEGKKHFWAHRIDIIQGQNIIENEREFLHHLAKLKKQETSPAPAEETMFCPPIFQPV